MEDEVEDWVDEAEVGDVEIEDDELENEDDVDEMVELEALDENEDDVEELEAAAELKELEDEEIVDEEKVVDAAAKGYPEQLGVTVTVTVLMLTLTLMEHILMTLGRTASPETRVERIARPMAKE